MRIPKRSLARLGAEFLLIVVGVLAALGLDQWWEDREDRARELAYVQRLRDDLVSDTLAFAWFRGVLDTKEAVLNELISDSVGSGWFDAPELQLGRIRHSTFFGLPPITSATFNELLSTGNVNLLRSDELRGQLGSYYSFYARLTTILDILPGNYRSIVWGSLPGQVEYAVRRNAASFDTTSIVAGLHRLRSHPDLAEAINHELYYSAGLGEYLEAARSRAADLLLAVDQLYGPST